MENPKVFHLIRVATLLRIREFRRADSVTRDI